MQITDLGAKPVSPKRTRPSVNNRIYDVTKGRNETESAVDLKITCPKCGGLVFDAPPDRRRGDLMRCRTCGAVATYGKLERAAIETLRKILQKAFPEIDWK